METWTGERTIWAAPGDHLKEFRQIANYYMEAMGYAKGKRVLDVGCGNGFGTFLLSLVASDVIGVDISEEIFASGEARLPFQAHTTFQALDLDKDLAPEGAELCVAIELIEHLEHPDFFLENEAAAIFFTIPCYGDRNPFHKIQYSEASAAGLIRKHYPELTYRMEAGHMIGYAFRPDKI